MNRSEPGPRRRPGKLLGLDVGRARIGVATCDPLGITVRPLTVLHRRSRDEDFGSLARLVEQEGAQAIVCGLPLNMDGSEGPQAREVRRWARRLARALAERLGRSVPIVLWDERLSTFAAQEILEQEGGTARGTPEDAAAAAVILRSYLDALERGEPVEERFGRIEAHVP